MSEYHLSELITGKVTELNEWPTAEEFREKYLKTNTPFVVRNGLKLIGKGHLTTLWTNDYLKEKCGSYKLRCNKLKKEDYGFFTKDLDDVRSGHEIITMPFKEFMDFDSTEERLIIYDFTSPVSRFKVLHEDLGGHYIPKGYFAEDKLEKGFQGLFISQKNVKQITHTHLDTGMRTNFVAMIRGTKRWLIWPWSRLKHMYVGELSSTGTEFVISKPGQDGNPIDFNMYPNIKKEPCLECFVREGDVLFNPADAFHHVTTADATDHHIQIVSRYGDEVTARITSENLFLYVARLFGLSKVVKGNPEMDLKSELDPDSQEFKIKEEFLKGVSKLCFDLSVKYPSYPQFFEN